MATMQNAAVALRRRQIGMPRQFLNRLRRRSTHRQMRAERMPKGMDALRAEVRSTFRPAHTAASETRLDAVHSVWLNVY